MGVEFTKVIGEGQLLGLWRIENKIRGNSEPFPSSSQAFARRKNYKKEHSLACRELLKSMTGWEDLDLDKDENGKPFIKNNRSHISLSHSGHFAAAMLNTAEPIGIDIQEVREKIIKIAPKFISEKEYSYLKAERKIEAIHVIWGAKEAMFKKHGIGEVLFKEHIVVHPFICELEGYVTVSFKKTGYEDTCTFKYEFINDYCLVYSACHL
jgi:phosphopantetheinyl transferase